MSAEDIFYEYMEPLFKDPNRAISNIWDGYMGSSGALGIGELIECDGYNINDYDWEDPEVVMSLADAYTEYMVSSDCFPHDWLIYPQ